MNHEVIKLSLIGEIAYIIFCVLMIIVPITAGIRRYWVAALIYAAGSLLFVTSLFKDRGGWEDLANFATLLVVVLPIYLVGTAAWIWEAVRRKRMKL
jgi:hypothetical protein